MWSEIGGAVMRKYCRGVRVILCPFSSNSWARKRWWARKWWVAGMLLRYSFCICRRSNERRPFCFNNWARKRWVVGVLLRWSFGVCRQSNEKRPFCFDNWAEKLKA